jgi:hypothetical protein
MVASVDTLCARLEETESLLRQVHEDHWADWLRKDLNCIRGGDIEGLSHLRSAYGGMGSFNDLVIHANSHNIGPDEYEAVNTRLDGLRASIFEQLQLVRQQFFEQSRASSGAPAWVIAVAVLLIAALAVGLFGLR